MHTHNNGSVTITIIARLTLHLGGEYGKGRKKNSFSYFLNIEITTKLLPSKYANMHTFMRIYD